MNSMSQRISRVCAMLALAFVTSIALAQVPLEGRKFDTEAGLTGKPAHVKQDILSFAGGKFHSSDCDQYGYGRGDYQATTAGDAVTFEVETRSEQYGRNVWKGVVKGDQIEGTMVFYRKPTLWRPNPDPLNHWFRGKAIQ